jgi:hypothetical protein
MEAMAGKTGQALYNEGLPRVTGNTFGASKASPWRKKIKGIILPLAVSPPQSPGQERQLRQPLARVRQQKKVHIMEAVVEGKEAYFGEADGRQGAKAAAEQPPKSIIIETYNVSGWGSLLE